ncbi:acyl-CoA dehydrogenase family protein [Cohnella fermenti]|uniref:Acyl-CoA dehydrogenase n=1 Tax=Cohnella fermenti TaxID=2565925 RepID=A0A4S4BSR6_9BACL|nr:acyl-CoA dehydrogenase [Cohnella fermenti]THF78057.1 acyl-CoA dehydrogenase [Cohnella fermenti]
MRLYDGEEAARIRERSAAMEAAGEIDGALLDLAYEERLFKLFVPSELNGRMTPLPEAARLFERASWIDGAFGWLVTIGSGGGFFAGTLPEEEARRLFSGREAVLAGSGMPTGRAVSVPGGYAVNGRWSFCSGSTFASFFTANVMIEREGEAAEMRSFAFLPEQVEIVRDWNPLGLRATASHTIEVKDAFVPAEMTFDIVSEPRLDDAIYRYPFLPFAQVSFAASSLGVYRHYLDECRLFAEQKSEAWREKSPQRLQALIGELEEQEGRLARASDDFYRTIDRTWQTFERERTLPDEDWEAVSRASREAASVARSGSEAIFPLLGMTALRYDHPLSRTWRDLHTVTQHSALLPLAE